jgi:tetrahydrodipicolinate N-succinyltransferase
MPLYKKKTTKDNKRKKVVKGKTISGNAKFKRVTNKKTGITKTKTKTGLKSKRKP